MDEQEAANRIRYPYGPYGPSPSVCDLWGGWRRAREDAAREEYDRDVNAFKARLDVVAKDYHIVKPERPA